MEPILRNSANVLDKDSVSKIMDRNSYIQGGRNLSTTTGAPPPPPPRPSLMSSSSIDSYPYGNGYGSYNSYSPYGSYGSSYGGYGGYGSSFGNYGGFYRPPSLYSPYMGNGYQFQNGAYPVQDGIRNFQDGVLPTLETFVRTFGDFASILDSTLFAMTSSFRAVLSVAENFGRLKSMFGKIWYSVNIFRFFSWLYRKLTGKCNMTEKNQIWNEVSGKSRKPGFSWGSIAMLGAILSAPYVIAKLFSSQKLEETPNVQGAPGLKAKAAFDFSPNSQEELPFRKNDIIALAPVEVQEKYGLKNSGWALGKNQDGRSGLVPLNYLLINRKSNTPEQELPIPRPQDENLVKSSIIGKSPEGQIVPEKSEKPVENEIPEKSPKIRKKVSFGETQIFNVDTEEN